MASRYPSIKVVDYCLHPVHVVDDDKDIIVPCGKCDGCLLHKANEWSMRCGMEIEGSPATIFGTLTYTNKYLPKLSPVEYCRLVNIGNSDSFGFPSQFPCDLALDYGVTWFSDYSQNIRFNGVRDVPREDHIVVNRNYAHQDITNWDSEGCPSIPYASKRDFQLWLKLLRRYLDENIHYKDKRVLERGYFRYFIISEFGPYSYRPHGHFLIFCQSQEVASALLEGALYENWKMCLPERFYPYCHLCDSGARGYVTQYLTSFSELPDIYKEVKELRPFRLSSKSPSIGYIEQDKAKIYEDISNGVIQYSRKVTRLDSQVILSYPKDFISTLFPKCYQFNKVSDSGRVRVYGYLYRAVREFGESYFVLSSRLRKDLHSSDYLATSACYRFCKEFVASPDYYYYLLDTYYYKLEMQHLRSFYESQEFCDFHSDPYLIFEYYPNIEQLCFDLDNDYKFVPRCLYFLMDLGFHVPDLLGNSNFFLDVHRRLKLKNKDYFCEVKDIINNMVKVSKFNEMTGNAPTSV